MGKIHPIAIAPSVALSALASSRKVLMHGGEHTNSLMMEITARAACRRKPVRYICGDNRFDPYAIARFARLAGVDSYSVLDSILIARAFTAYQLVELVERLDNTPSNECLIISGPCSSFYDEDIPLIDAARLFYRMLWRLVDYSRSGKQVLMVQCYATPPARRAYFLTDICRLSDVVLQLSGEHTFTIERRMRLLLPQVAQVDEGMVN